MMKRFVRVWRSTFWSLDSISKLPKLAFSKSLSSRNVSCEPFLIPFCLNRKSEYSQNTPDLFNFAEKVKVEDESKPLPKAIKVNKSPQAHSSKTTDMSVMEVPQAPNEVILIEETQTNHQMDDDTFDDILTGDFNEELSPERVNRYATAMSSPIRKKSEKLKLPGFDCRECEDVSCIRWFGCIWKIFNSIFLLFFQWYRFVGRTMTDKEIQERLNACSKHKKNTRVPDTPPGYWDIKFPETPEDQRIETPVDYRFTKRSKDWVRVDWGWGYGAIGIFNFKTFVIQVDDEICRIKKYFWKENQQKKLLKYCLRWRPFPLLPHCSSHLGHTL